MSGKVDIEGVTKRYGEIAALENIKIHIKAKEFVSLLGPSGSGKTTLLMVVAGFSAPDAGNIFIDGNDITQVPPHQRNIGVVFQNYALFPHMTVRENIEYPLKMRRILRENRKRMVNEIIDVVQLQTLESRRPGQLSGGQQQRVALARAMVFHPPILLMDEPLSALDKNLRTRMQLELKHIAETIGTTVLYVTHDQEEALVLSDRICVLNKGRIEQIGKAPEIYDSPANRFVAEFVGETNFFRTDTVHQGRQRYLSVRPEKIIFVDEGSTVPHALEGILDDVIYLGDSMKFYVRISRNGLSEGNLVVVKIQNGRGIIKKRRGEKVKIGWRKTDEILVG
jgi:putative spermidine/putrescine transport system ATP-binding protein